MFLATLQLSLFFSFPLSTFPSNLEQGAQQVFFLADPQSRRRSVLPPPHLPSLLCIPSRSTHERNPTPHTLDSLAQKKCRTYENFPWAIDRTVCYDCDTVSIPLHLCCLASSCDILSPLLAPYPLLLTRCVLSTKLLLYYLVADFRCTHGPRLKLTGNIKASCIVNSSLALLFSRRGAGLEDAGGRGSCRSSPTPKT